MLYPLSNASIASRVFQVYTSLLWGRSAELEWWICPLNKESILPFTFKPYRKPGQLWWCLKVITSLLIKKIEIIIACCVNFNWWWPSLCGERLLRKVFQYSWEPTHKPPGCPYPADMRRNKICRKTWFSKRNQRILNHSGLVWNQVTQAVKLF